MSNLQVLGLLLTCYYLLQVRLICTASAGIGWCCIWTRWHYLLLAVVLFTSGTFSSFEALLLYSSTVSFLSRKYNVASFLQVKTCLTTWQITHPCVSNKNRSPLKIDVALPYSNSLAISSWTADFQLRHKNPPLTVFSLEISATSNALATSVSFLTQAVSFESSGYFWVAPCYRLLPLLRL